MNILLCCLSYVIGSTDTDINQLCSLVLLNPKDNVCFVKCKDKEEGLLSLRTNMISIEYTDNKDSSTYIEENESGATSIIFEDLTEDLIINEYKGEQYNRYNIPKNIKEIRIEFFYDDSTRINFLDGKKNSHYSISLLNPKENTVFKYENEQNFFFVTNMSLVCLYCDCNSETNLLSFRKGKISSLVLLKPVSYCDTDSYEPFNDFRYDPIKIDDNIIIYYVADKNTKLFFHYNDERVPIYEKDIKLKT